MHLIKSEGSLLHTIESRLMTLKYKLTLAFVIPKVSVQRLPTVISKITLKLFNERWIFKLCLGLIYKASR